MGASSRPLIYDSLNGVRIHRGDDLARRIIAEAPLRNHGTATPPPSKRRATELAGNDASTRLRRPASLDQQRRGHPKLTGCAWLQSVRLDNGRAMRATTVEAKVLDAAPTTTNPVE
jgi:hypothetical protein